MVGALAASAIVFYMGSPWARWLGMMTHAQGMSSFIRFECQASTRSDASHQQECRSFSALCRACAAFLATDRVKTVALWRGGWLAIQGVVAQELDVSVAPGPLLLDAMARETANSISNLPLFPGRMLQALLD